MFLREKLATFPEEAMALKYLTLAWYSNLPKVGRYTHHTS